MKSNDGEKKKTTTSCWQMVEEPSVRKKTWLLSRKLEKFRQISEIFVGSLQRDIAPHIARHIRVFGYSKKKISEYTILFFPPL